MQQNNGKFLEQLIDKTIQEYNLNNIALVHRNFLPVSFYKVQNNLKLERSKINHKSTVDYYGVFKGHFFAFDVKSTIYDFFLKQNIAKHQQQYLLNVNNNLGIAFYVIGFVKNNKYYAISVEKFNKMSWKTPISYFKKNAFEIDFKLPGYLDFIKYIKEKIA